MRVQTVLLQTPVEKGVSIPGGGVQPDVQDMKKPALLHMLTPMPQVSPFDVNMAYDAGFAAVVPYTGVRLDDVVALTRDAIFSRFPEGLKRTGIFLGGRDPLLALDMLQRAQNAMAPSFQVSLFADPSGAFTAAAAMLALAERQLRRAHGAELAGRRALVLGSGPVGQMVCVLLARAGAQVHMLGHDQHSAAPRVALRCSARFGIRVTGSAGGSRQTAIEALQDAELLFAAAKAGVQVMSTGMLRHAVHLLVAADANPVAPAGIEGIEPADDGARLGAGSGIGIGIGPRAIGHLKYRVHQALLQQMLGPEAPVCLDFTHAIGLARRYVA